MKRSLLLLCLAALPVCAQEPLWFLQMSDPQFGMYTANQDFQQETANFQLAIATANRLHPKFVVICGDLVNKPGDAAQIAEFQRIARQLDPSIALHVVAGNHDVGNEPTPATLQAYRQKFGDDYYTFSHPGFEGVVLNSSLIQHPEKAADEAAKQERWLTAELEKAKRAGVGRIVIFQHIPFFLGHADDADDYFNIPREARARYLALLDQAGVRYVFAGHLHYANTAESGRLQIFAAGPVGKPLGKGASGLRIVRLDSTGLKEQYFDFGHLPNRLDEAWSPNN